MSRESEAQCAEDAPAAILIAKRIIRSRKKPAGAAQGTAGQASMRPCGMILPVNSYRTDNNKIEIRRYFVIKQRSSEGRDQHPGPFSDEKCDFYCANLTENERNVIRRRTDLCRKVS